MRKVPIIWVMECQERMPSPEPWGPFSGMQFDTRLEAREEQVRQRERWGFRYKFRLRRYKRID